MTKKLIPRLSLFILAFTLFGCLEQSGSSEQTAIPDARVECSQAMVFTHCRQSGERLWIGITKSFDLNCGSVLSSFSSQTRNNYFEAFAENVSLTQSGILVQANVTSWSAPTGGTLRSLASGTYKMCAFIEASNGDGRLGNGEPMSDSFFRVGGESPQLVNDWTSY